jgi:hypothetical protein
VKVVVLLAAVVGAGCGSHASSPPRPDGGDAAAKFDARDAGAEMDRPAEVAPPDAQCGADAGATKKATGQACGCAAECASGFCADGVCCNTACAETCKSCSAAGSVGTCTFVVAGAKPRDAKPCAAADPSSCGWDGTCDGGGGCRRYVAGTVCKAGTCDGDAVVGALACDGAGRCKPGPTVICAPYSCNPAVGACFDTCAASSQCVSGQQCVNASCGKKMKSATCAKNVDCASGFCADGVCCNVACQGGCVSCGLVGRQGTCWPIDSATPDPRGICKDQGAPSCGATGRCDGFGGCEKYAPETECIAPSCTGNRRNTPGTCDGLGTCRPQGVQNCSPFGCVAGACNRVCTSDSDCDTGRTCIGGLCGKKPMGQACAVDTECLSGQCVDGYCCDSACSGACRSCALPSMLGHCTSMAMGSADPRGACTDQGAQTCSTNGKCDGSGGCQKYRVGTLCAAETCSGNVYTPSSTCNATGQCMPPDSLPCSPYVCNGTTCFNACASDQNCLTPNVCNGSSCGKKARGASCSDPVECQSTFCAQGVCCDTACTDSCQSCALSGALGTCSNVPTGSSDPAEACPDQGAGTCGTTSKCQAGTCQKYAQGTACKDSTCPAQTTTFTPGSTCDGAGACVTPGPSSCFPFKCGVLDVCKAACIVDADCAPPAVCNKGSCGLKGLGKTCADGMECFSGFCAQGFCCNAACNGTCQTCALATALGTCSNVPDGGNDPKGTCSDKGPASCTTDGVCNGQGACRVYTAGTPCMAAFCPTGSSTLTQQRACDGQGACKAATTQACAPYKCNGTSACNAACTLDADCLAPNICDPQTNLCGNKKRLGQSCQATPDCLTGNFCVDGVCCGAASCGLCQTCAVPGFAGSCTTVAAGSPEPHGNCDASPPCGNTGNCSGGGTCEQGGTGVSCGTASCAGSTYTPVSHCSGSGSCATAAVSTCSPYLCGAGACLTVCATDAECIAPFTCQGSGSTRSCALKANGLSCASGGQCISGNCVDGVCCGSSSCPACQACNISGSGACAPVAAGVTAPTTFCTDQGTTTCGTNGKCDGSGGCQKYADGTSCSAATCPGGTATLKLAGACSGGSCSVPTQSCSPYFCDGAAACHSNCNVDADCLTGNYCTGTGGSCLMKGTPGTSCTGATQCATGNCVDSVCCGSASCGSCQACNVSGNAGTCSPVGAGAADPKGVCTDNGAPTCGTNGKCDGAGGCQKYPNSTGCSAATCPGGTTTLKLPGSCSGGSCSVPTQSCAPYFCNGAAACRTTCNVDGDCTSGFYCTGAGGSCMAKGGPGASCGAGNQCGTANCVDGVCCASPSCGSCQACNVSGSAGACAPVAAGTADPKAVCTDNGAANCGTSGKCDGAGGCQKYPNGTGCSAATCPGGTATLNLAGSCSGGSCSVPTQSCAPYFCNGAAACRVTCSLDADCASSHYCNVATSTCLPRGIAGASCTAGNQCTTTHCVDSVCCGSASCGSCQACNVAGSAGTCSPVAAGSADPKAVCGDNGAGACGTNGKCDGAGGCQKYIDGTTCSTAVCPNDSSTLTVTGTCGSGSCGAGTQSCGAFKCDGVSACRTTCAGDGDCSAGNYCGAMPVGTCTPKLGDGSNCGGRNQCANDHCVDGVCCGSAACGSCQACNVAGSKGACAALAAGTPDPKAVCQDLGAAACGTDGLCNGAGGCEKYLDGTVCAPASCLSGSIRTLPATCGSGACGATTQDCAPYKCDGATACLATCSNDGDCSAGNYCLGMPMGTCTPKQPTSSACTAANQCQSANCVGGFCCNTSCLGTCQSCGLTGSEGTCTNLAEGTPASTACPSQAVATCGNTGFCNASGGCQKYDAGTVCLDASCPALTETITSASLCNGTGTCVAGTASNCGAYQCLDDSTGCKVSCATPMDCAAGYTNCLADSCAP